MSSRAALVAGVVQAILLSSVVWVAPAFPAWVAPMAAAAVVVRPLLATSGPLEPWVSLATLVSAAAAALTYSGSKACGGWLLLGLVVVGVGRLSSDRRPLLGMAAGHLAVVGWGTALALEPELLEPGVVGWLAPALLLVMARRIGLWRGDLGVKGGRTLLPPTRDVRGTLTLDSVVLAGEDGLRRSAPIELELRAGEAVAVLCDDALEREALVAALAGARQPLSGEIAIDGVPLEPRDRLVAVVSRGQPFVIGDLTENLGALAGLELDPATFSAAVESCSLADAVSRLGDRRLDAHGRPLAFLERLLVQAARVLCSDYRVVVVDDCMPWVNAVRGETWRQAVVRASVGRTAVWITIDHDLARRAHRVVELRNGVMRSASQARLSWRTE